MTIEPDLEAEQPEEDVDPRPFIFEQLELDGEAFLALSKADQEEQLNVVEGAQLRRHLGFSFFCLLLIAAFMLSLNGGILVVASGLGALLAGRDIARLAHKRRVLAYARDIFLTDEESAES